MVTTFIFTLLFALFCTILAFVFHQKHILLTLLALELMMLFLILLLFCHLNSLNLPLTPPLILITFSASEASLGLALLVVLIRKAGNDHVSLLTLSKS